MKVSVVKGEDRRENIILAVKPLIKDIEKAIKNKKSKQLFIKINAIDPNFPIACTNIEALDAVLSIFYSNFDEIIVGDNSFVFIKNKGGPYRAILNKYPNIKLTDLTEFETENIEFKKLDGITCIGEVSLLSRKAFTISIALPKTHDTFVYTGCLKNMFGCVIKNRGALHALKPKESIFINKYIKSNKIKWDNLVNVIKKTKPDLCILDAFEGMEGDGPIFGSKVHLGIAMCSLDGVALDNFASKICGLESVPYLSMLSEDSYNIKIIKKGFKNIEEISQKFKLHYNYKYQIATLPKFLLLPIDFKAIFSVLKRSYRIKDKIIDKMMGLKNAAN